MKLSFSTEQAKLDFLTRHFDYDPETGEFAKKLDKGSIFTSGGLVFVSVSAVRCPVQRLAYYIVHGIIPEIVEHIDKDRTNNRIANLRCSSIRTNSARRIDANASHPGTHRDDRDSKWRSTFALHGRTNILWTSDSRDECAYAYQVANEITRNNLFDHRRDYDIPVGTKLKITQQVAILLSTSALEAQTRLFPAIVRYWYQPKAVMELIMQTAKGDLHVAHAVAHLLFGTLVQNAHDSVLDRVEVPVAVPYAAWEELGCRPSDVEALGILRPEWEYARDGQCRRFVLDPAFVLRLLGVAVRNIDGPWCNVIDGMASKSRAFEKVKSFPKKTAGRPRSTGRAEINWLKAKQVAYDMLRKAEAVTSIHHRARAIQAIRCLLAIRATPTFRMMRKKPGFASYVPVYHQVDCGGRWYEQGSAFQGLPGVVKAALIEGTDQVNYDLRACHVAAAVALAGEINSHAMYVGDEHLIIGGLDASPEEKLEGVLGARDLLKSKKYYDVIAVAVDLPRKVVKTCIIACLYGGSAGSWVDVDDDGRVRRSTAVMETLLEHHGGDISAARKSHKRLYPKLANIVRFAEGLLRAMTLTMTTPKWWRRCRGRLRRMIMIGYNGNVTNAVRTTIKVPTGHNAPYAERRAAARRVLSHVLTGIEQDTIGHLLQSCKDHGVVVVHLEHDGLVVRGNIPAACVDEMRRDSLLAAYADLDLKPFPIADATDPLDRLVKRVLAVTTEADNIQE